MDFIGPLKIFKKFGNYEQRIDAIFNKYDPIIEKVIKKRQEIVNKRRSGEILEGEEESVVFLDTLLEYAQDETMEIKITKEQIKGLVVVSFFSSNCFVIEYTYYILGKIIICITSTNDSS
jgi:2-hydroxyisoflavanone synthase